MCECVFLTAFKENQLDASWGSWRGICRFYVFWRRVDRLILHQQLMKFVQCMQQYKTVRTLAHKDHRKIINITFTARTISAGEIDLLYAEEFSFWSTLLNHAPHQYRDQNMYALQDVFPNQFLFLSSMLLQQILLQVFIRFWRSKQAWHQCIFTITGKVNIIEKVRVWQCCKYTCSVITMWQFWYLILSVFDWCVSTCVWMFSTYVWVFGLKFW